MLSLWIQTVSSFAMLIIILLVQVLIYPQFKHVNSNDLPKYAKFHIKKISWVVIPFMLAELISLLTLWTNKETWSFWLISATGLLVLIWVLTFLKIAPLHNQIALNSDAELLPKLIQLNSVRTMLWTLKSASVFCLFIVFIMPNLQYQAIYNANINTKLTKPNGSKVIHEGVISSKDLNNALSALNAHLIDQEGSLQKYIVRTSYLKFPDLLIIDHKKELTILWSKSLMGYFDFGKNKDRLKWIQKRL
ncbi:hypothetical protein DID80_08445 [Candidatus Marinamargulisbacteria bacterium SCGC AAA071-K20]|nr:hypothetical protein DID80_08445 [Candidatus Marinamargulisbacteria bacterium SCGC AAA071-K20]